MTNFLLRTYRRILNSIAFYPTIMGILSVVFALFMIPFEYSEVSVKIKDKISPALVNDPESARLILGTVVGGIISLMVFSFTMVMAVLNRATATLSPRVLPGLVSKKFHQVVLGFYIGTIIFSLMLIVNIHTADDEIEVPSLGVLISMFSAVGCLGLFVYFIHSISEAIQVDAILNTILRSSLQDLKKRIKWDKNEGKQKEITSWIEIPAEKAGYFKHANARSLLNLLQKEDAVLKTNAHRGFYIMPGYPYLSINKELPEEKLKIIKNKFEFYNEEYASDHYTYGFNQITEIAVKALSPGINDPGTAIKALDMLALLFTERMKISEYEKFCDDENIIRFIYQELSFEKLMYNTIAPIREYGKNDALVIVKILEMLKNVMHADKDRKYFNILLKEVNATLEDAKGANRNFRDKEALNDAIKSVNKIANIEIALL